MNRDLIIGKNACILSRASHAYLDERLKAYGLNKAHVEILLIIIDQGYMTHNSVAKYFMYNKSTISKAISHLERLHLVQRISDTKDKRVKYITATDLGKERAQTYRTILWEYDLFKWSSLNDEELDQLSHLMRKLVVDAFDKYEEDSFNIGSHEVVSHA